MRVAMFRLEGNYDNNCPEQERIRQLAISGKWRSAQRVI